jgi:hypothetical protein
MPQTALLGHLAAKDVEAQQVGENLYHSESRADCRLQVHIFQTENCTILYRYWNVPRATID